MPKVSVVIPTHNRPELLAEAIKSVLNQTFQDFEIIIVDDGVEKRADKVCQSFSDPRIIYINHDLECGGGAARNTGIKKSNGKYIAFLDDDDQWIVNKLSIQLEKLDVSSGDVGFCFSAVENIFVNHREITTVPDGVADYHELALRRFKGFLTVTLVIKKEVFKHIGFFDETLPSHQEIDLIIRITKHFLGIGINQPLVNVRMGASDQVGANFLKKVTGRKILLEKYSIEYQKRPKDLAFHYFYLGLLYRDQFLFAEAKNYFFQAFMKYKNFKYFLHLLTMLGDGFVYKILLKFKS